MREYHFYVYILQSASRRALYIGVTNNLHHRIFQHRNHQFEGFTDGYNATRLVYWEHRQRWQGNRPREAAETLAEGEETVASRNDESQVARHGRRLAPNPNTRSLDSAARPPSGRAAALEMTGLVFRCTTPTCHPERSRGTLCLSRPPSPASCWVSTTGKWCQSCRISGI